MSLECPRESASSAKAKDLLKRHGIAGDKVRFKSRYMPDDLVRIYRTLEILAKHSERSLAQFVAHSFRAGDDHRRAIQRMATALDQLTYAGGTVSAETFDQDFDDAAHEAASFRLPSKCKRQLFNRKRLWCSLRDFLKSPVFNPLFVEGLAKRGVEDPGRWARTNPGLRQAHDAIELPGDVWNNAKDVSDGLFSPYLAKKPASWDMPRTIREVYKLLGEGHDLRFYPEQLEVTFSFVPRMCRERMCDVCAFGSGIRAVTRAGDFCYICGWQHDATNERFPDGHGEVNICALRQAQEHYGLFRGHTTES